MSYDPPRQKIPREVASYPLEVELVLNTRTCGTCNFFWPDDPSHQPYGPYPSYDFKTNTPVTASADGSQTSFKWLSSATRPPIFPDAEVMDGCRKAPIMTIGINPNLTAFLPGQNGSAWCYPSFSSSNDTDSWVKYAYYYRYRSVFQERFDTQFVRQHLLADGRIFAEKPGVIVSADRPDDAPGYSIQIRYDGDTATTTIALPGRLGEPRYVLLFDETPPKNRFGAGDLIAARLDVPAGLNTDIYAQQISYYERMRPVLDWFETFLHDNGHSDAQLRIGEDVCQLDMVACASPHWGPQWLGGSPTSVHDIISNCVTRNAWALKQLLQTRPAIVFLVGEASYSMFRVAFGHLIVADPPLPETPEDGAFTLLRATTEQPCIFAYSTTLDGEDYRMSTRVVVTPHFSYASNFLPQYRLGQSAWIAFCGAYPECAAFLQHDPRLRFNQPSDLKQFITIAITNDEPDVTTYLEETWPAAADALAASRCDAFNSMTRVLREMYAEGALGFTPPSADGGGYLTRGEGPCSFCVNARWQFPEGCPYGKPAEASPQPGFLEQVAAEILTGARAAPATAVVRMLDDGFESRLSSPQNEIR